jgi:hypothetical protein
MRLRTLSWRLQLIKISQLLLLGHFVSFLRVSGDVATDIPYAVLGNKQRVCVYCTGFQLAACKYCSSRL